MPCPTCGSEDTIPLTLKAFDNLAGAARCCEECQTVYLVVNDASLPSALRDRQIKSWQAVRAVLDDAVDALTQHPVTRRLFSDPHTDDDAWRRAAMETLEHAVAALAPVIRALAEPQERDGS